MKKLFAIIALFSILLVGCASNTEEKVAKNGDYVNIDFVGKIEGVAFDGGTAQGYELKLGSNTFIDGFEEQVVGMKIDEQKTIKVTFPEQYTADLAGKEATFDITLHKIYRELK